MPETEKPADGQQSAETKTVTVEVKKPENPERTFTQQELDDIVKARVARAVPEDYEELKKLKVAKDEEDEAKKNDLQKAQDAATKAKQERDEARAEALATKRETAIQLEAVAQGGDPELVAMALAKDETIKVEDGQVVGTKEAVEALLTRKPNLKTGGVRQSGGEFGGVNTATTSERIAELEAKGDPQSLAEARRLKVAQHLQSG
jgi:hypothetical protein